ncbi:MAG: hypothetical protein Q8O25_03345, partial [Sulfurisoma sp.]|nr:hypothetical protein [Sulfurisoma sp.]
QLKTPLLTRRRGFSVYVPSRQRRLFVSSQFPFVWFDRLTMIGHKINGMKLKGPGSDDPNRFHCSRYRDTWPARK